MKDISGKRFGRLVAMKQSERKGRDGTNYWICYCDCGSCTAASYGSLVDGTAISCGCHKLIGRHYGWLEVTDIVHGQVRCRCACGNEIDMPRSLLSTRTSCGCEHSIQASISGQVSLFPAENAIALEKPK